ncbi:uncharacterized protein LOC129611949 [Condylostylus longicornis]|uniref:uncharacterized protein LOC129611949 n=1 Tax=Condylostylus longicornis TaxID=2530218 RepID=UPI00244E0C47|nr:uncharacterized protein LOC129611949 [Condylostylus longicornis]
MKYFRLLAIILALNLFSTVRTAPLENDVEKVEEKEDYRLPTNVVPTNYNLTIKPYILRDGIEREKFQFDGFVNILLKPIVDNVDKIALHKKNITIISRTLVKQGTPEEKIDITNDNDNAKTDIWTLTLKEPLVKDQHYILRINYTGYMGDDMKGFYKSSYKKKNGEIIWIGATQFQTHHARRAFPCFDEPGFKATFDIHINHEKEFTKVISNTKQVGDPKNDGDDRKIVTFSTTPKMSTYLVAFLVSDFIENGDSNDLSIVARPEYESQTQYSLQAGKTLLKTLGDYFELPYKDLGNPKMHMAAIPDFSAGAMENWGLLTYRERALLNDDKETTDMGQQSISLIIAHEQTHMWFGDYVTCDWWNHTWLNEGFATYFQYFGSAKEYPKWDLDKQFVVDQVHTVLPRDSLSDTHAMSDKNINSPTDLGKMFGSISYNKGASIIRMIRYSMGEEKFQKAIRKYLKDNKEGSSRPALLFKAFDSEWKPENLNTTEFYLSWTEQVGYPIIKVKLSEDRKKIEIEQQRFLLEDDAGNEDLIYYVPFTYTTQKNPKFGTPNPGDIQFFNKNSTTFSVSEELGESDYVIANIEQMGYFRVWYEDHMLHNIHHALTTENFGKIGEINRAHLIDDLFNFGRAGTMKYDLIFDVLSYLEKEKHYIPWKAAFSGFKNIEARLGKENDDLKKRLHMALPAVYDHLTFNQTNDESRLDTYNRANVLSWACKYDFKDCNENSMKLFDDFKKDKKNAINKNIRSVVYCSAVRTAENLTNYNYLKDHFISTETSTEQTLVLNALGCVKKQEHIKAHYDFILSDAVRKQDRQAALNALIAENPESPQHVFDLIVNEHGKLGEALGGYETDVANVVLNIASHFNSEEQKKSIEKFSEKLTQEAPKNTLKDAVKRVEKNMSWLDKYKADLVKGLRGGAAAITFSAVLIAFTTILMYMKDFRLLGIILLLNLFYTIRTAPLENEIENVDEKEEYRLPTNVVPTNYNLTIKPYILRDGIEREKFQFDGFVNILLKPIVDNVDKIALHKKNITIISRTLVKQGTPEEKIDITNDNDNAKTDIWTLTLKEPLVKDQHYILRINYTGYMGDDMKGFYKSSYKKKNGEIIWIGATQFQTHYARQAFPCFDEPGFKATFDIHINHEKEFTKVISNTKQVGDPKNDGDDRKIVTFSTTPKMSTYLVAFLVSDFIENGDSNDLSIVARPEYESQTQYSLQAGKTLLKTLGDYFELPYKDLGNPKMHMAAIPDFSAGAMENWGLLTYRERALLNDDKETTDIAQQRISLVIAHEQTHMWFGDYVTCDWWNHTWLNEGFARYFQYFASAKEYPKWDLDKQFVVDNVHTVLPRDSLSDTHAMSDKNINSQTEIRKMFGTISYNKGSSIIRMIRYSMGEEKFQKAIRKYLKDNKEGSSRPALLFKAFDSEWKPENLNTTEFYLSWTEQVGYPIIKVKLSEDRKKIEIEQQRFLLEDDAGNEDLIYYVPFTYTTQKNPKFGTPNPGDIQFFNKNSTTFSVSEELGESDYVIANIEQMGYFRVWYEDHMLHNIHHALTTENFGKIGEINRAHLIDDLFNFGRAGTMKYDLIFDILSYLEKEKHYIPWTAAFSGFKNIEARLGKENDDLKKRLHMALPAVYDHLTFNQTNDESRLDTYNRANVLSWACKYDFKDCNENSMKLFDDFKKDKKNAINKNIRSVVYCSAVRTAENLTNYNYLKDHFISTETSTEQTLVLNALGCVKKQEHIKAHYDFILSDAVRKQDRQAALNALIAENPESPQHVFDLIVNEHGKLGEALGGYETDVANVVLNIASHFNSEEQKKSIEKFSEKLTQEAPKNTLKDAVKRVEKNMSWLDKYKADLIKGLRGGAAAITFSAVLIAFTTILMYLSKQNLLIIIKRFARPRIVKYYYYIRTMHSKLQLFIIFSTVYLFEFSLSHQTLQNDFFKEEMTTHRLKGLIEPIHYNINLTVYMTDELKQFTYYGRVSILFKTFLSNINEIILHKSDSIRNMSEIIFENCYTKEHFQISEIKINNATEKYGIVLDKSMQPGIIYNLTIEFKNNLSNDMIGFYKSSYKDENGNKKWLATTQFNDKHARKAFPCFDEPKFKATFNITLNHEKQFSARSNTRLSNTIIYGSRADDTFEITPKMSTYLVVFLISEYADKSFDNHLTVLAPIHILDYSKYALETGSKSLKALNEYFQIDYDELGIDKMDMAAIPDFAAGAMENWGLLLFKEKYFLYDENTTSELDKQRIATVIAHEQSHMWFGNLITLEWWNHLWVNEGFARFFEYFIPHTINSDWELNKLFVFEQIHSSLLIDSLEGTGPMTIHESDTLPYNPPPAYTVVSYNKGASILRMFQYCMGKENFRNAMQNLLIEKKFQYATPEDVLIRFRNKWIHKDVNFMQFFSEWTEQPGYPVLQIDLLGDKKTIEIKQKRFILEGNATSPELNPNLLYTIPITFTTNVMKNFTIPKEENIIFMKSSESVKKILISEQPINWIILNIQQLGFYRVNYDEKTWLNLKEALSKSISDINEINRANLIDDLFNFARSGLLKYQFVFKILEYLKVETEYIPLSAALNGFHFLKIRLGQEYEKEFNEFLVNILSKAYNENGLEEKSNDELLKIYNRSKILKWICKFGHSDCIKKSLELFESEMKQKKKIPKNIRNAIYCTALGNSFDNEANITFEYTKEVYKNMKNPTDQQSLLAILGCVSSESNIKQHFDFILSEDVRLQDKMFALNSLISENVNKIEYILNLIGSNLDVLGKSFGGGENSVIGVISNLAQYFTEDNQITLMKDFINKSSYFTESGRKSFNKIVDKVIKNVQWKKDHKDDLEKALHGTGNKHVNNSILLILLGIFLYYIIY